MSGGTGDAELRTALARAARRVAQLEDERARLTDEHRLVSTSRGYRVMTAMQAGLGPARWLAIGARPVVALVRRLARATRVARVVEGVEHVRFRRSTMRQCLESRRDTTLPMPSEAVRWIGPVGVRGRVRPALLCRPDSLSEYRLEAAPGGIVRADAFVLPSPNSPGPAEVEFRLSVSSLEGEWSASVARVVAKDRPLLLRRWEPLALSLPFIEPTAIRVTLATRLVGGDPLGLVDAVWGEPRVDWRRSARDVLGMARGALRQYGLAGSIRRVLHHRPEDPNEAYREFLRTHGPSPAAFARLRTEVSGATYQPVVTVVVPVHNTEPRWLRACVESVRRQVYVRWELCLADDGSTSPGTREVLSSLPGDPRIKQVRLESPQGISGASNAALGLATGEFVAFLDHDDELTPDALAEVVLLLNRHPDTDWIYSDEDKLDLAGQPCDPYFKPDWSPELFLSYMYTCHLTVLRRALVEDLGGLRREFDGAQDYDLCLRAAARTDRVRHVPRTLYRWRKTPGSAAAEVDAKPWGLQAARAALVDHVRQRGLDAEVLPGAAPGLFRVRHRIAGEPLVTIVLPTDDRMREIDGRTIPLLRNCVRSVVQKTGYARYELLIVDNGRLSDESRAYLEQVPHRRVSFACEGPFNFSAKLNFAVGHARGDHLVVFNDDLEVISWEWLSAMLEHSQRKEIGAVGAKLFFPDGRLQHAGVLLGVCGVSAHAFHCHPGSAPGYAASNLVVRNCSAVTGACMMTRRCVFEEVGGFDERFALDFNDTDYCLRLRRAGYRIVFTPYSELYHHESATWGPRVQRRDESDAMRRRWGPELEHDPYYNPNLTRDFPDYRLRA